MADGGGILFICKEPTRYEVHTNFLKSHRGVYAAKASLAAYRWVFTHTDCLELWTQVPAFNRDAAQFCELVGAQKEFTRENIWPTENGNVDLTFWSMRYDDWLRQIPSLEIEGKRFHDKCESEYARLGKQFPGHREDHYHDRAAGACAEMIYGGQPEKAVILYNRYARIAGYPSVSLVSKNPLIIDTGDAVLQVFDRDFKVLKCR